MVPRAAIRLVALALVTATVASACSRAEAPLQNDDTSPRIVSLSPAITETLFLIGAGDAVVGVSQFCDRPDEVQRLPRVGTSLSPSYEAIVTLKPTLIVSEAAAGERIQPLRQLGRLESIPWLTIEDMVAGTRALGRLADHEDAAATLAERLQAALTPRSRADAPRVLFAIDSPGGQLTEVLFVRRNSVHGSALEAAGARNAVERDELGQPRLSLEEVIAIDPDMIVILSAGESSAAVESAILEKWRRLTPLRAVQANRLAIIIAPEAFIYGPRMIAFTNRLARTIADLQGAR